MFAKYNGEIYTFLQNKRKTEIITRNPDKASDNFSKDGDVFFKLISSDKLEDVFGVDILVHYDAGLPHTPKKWCVNLSDCDLSSKTFLLIFAKGLLTEWKVVDKNVCAKRIPFDDINCLEIICRYKRRSFIDFDEPLIEEKSFSKSELPEFVRAVKTFLNI